jgi:hypothetical protein
MQQQRSLEVQIVSLEAVGLEIPESTMYSPASYRSRRSFYRSPEATPVMG